MSDKEIPRHWSIFTGSRKERRNRLLNAVSLVVSSFKKKNLAATDSKPGSKRSSAGSRSYNDEVVARKLRDGGLALLLGPINRIRL